MIKRVGDKGKDGDFEWVVVNEFAYSFMMEFSEMGLDGGGGCFLSRRRHEGEVSKEDVG